MTSAASHGARIAGARNTCQGRKSKATAAAPATSAGSISTAASGIGAHRARNFRAALVP